MKVTAVIKPNSKHREEVIVSEDGGVVIYTKEPAIEGRANRMAIKLVARHYGVTNSQVSLVRGQSSKFKVFEVLN